MSEPATADGPVSPTPPARRARRPPASAWTVAEVIGASVLAGLVVGAAWRLVAPEVVVEVSDGRALPLPLEVRKLFGVDAWFAILGAAAGAVLALVMSTRHRHRPLAALFGLVTGGVLGSVAAWRFGTLLGPGPLRARIAEATDGARLVLPLDLEATSALLAWPIVAVVVVLGRESVAGNHPPWRPSVAEVEPASRPDPRGTSPPPSA